MKEQEREAASVRTSEKRKTREGEIHGVSGKLIESKSSRANLPGTLPNRSPFAPAPGLFPRSIPVTMLVSSYHVRNMERNFPDLFFVAGRVRVCRTFTLNGRENGLTARCDCVDEFFCRSNIASRWHAGSTAQRFWGDNASGRCRFWTMSEDQKYPRKPVLFGGLETAVSCISRSYTFKHPRWMRANSLLADCRKF